MLDRKFIVENPELVKQNCKNRNAPADVDRFVALEQQRKTLQGELDEANRKANETARSIGKAPPEQREALKEEGRRIREQAAQLQQNSMPSLAEADAIVRTIPNLSHPAAPVGVDDKANLEISRGKTPMPQFDFKPLDHVELAEKLDLIDFEGGARVAGHGFYFLKNDAVLLELALQRYALDVLLNEGFTPMTTPDLARNEVLQGIGFIPRGPETQIYSIEGSDLSLVATAEITLGGLFAGQTSSRRSAAEALRHQPLLPHRGRGRGPGLARPVPRPPVHQGRDVRLHAARRERRHARLSPRHGMPHFRRSGRALSRGRYGHRRPGRAGLSQVRPRGLDARPGRIRRSHQHVELHRLPGAAAEHPLPRQGRERARGWSTRSTAPPSPSAEALSP